MDKETKLDLAEILAKSERYLMPNYRRQEVAFTFGSGEVLYDVEGREYIDLLSGLATNTLGHANADWVAAVRDQADKLNHVSNLYHIAEQTALAELLVEQSLKGGKVFFCNSGAEANEAALKLSRKWGLDFEDDKFETVSLAGSFHGRTFGTMCLTGQEKIHAGFGPLPPGFKYVEPDNIEALELAVGDQTCAVFLELVQGEGGVRPLSEDFVRRARELTLEHDALLVIDEIQTGIGRTGTMFAYQQYEIEPDLITLGKGLGGGFPIGAVIGGERAAEVFAPGDHGSTFGGNPLACAVAFETVRSVLQQKLLDKVSNGNQVITEKFEELKIKFPFVTGYRGRGYLMGLILDPEFAGGDYSSIVKLGLEQGVILNITAGNILRIAPALNILGSKLTEGLDRLEKTLDAFYERAGAAT